MSDNTLDQAFPVHFEAHDGMTLRDYFAAKAMQGIASLPIPNEAHMFDGGPCKWISVNSYAIADAMLKTRQE